MYENALELAKGTYYEGKLCECEWFRTTNPVKITKDTRIMPDPPPCDVCGKWARHCLDECATCRAVYYRWFQYPISFNKKGLDCWDCIIKKAEERGFVAEGAGVIAPSYCLKIVPKSAEDIAKELEDIWASL